MRIIDVDKIPVIFEPVAYSNDCPIALDRETIEELVKHCSVDAEPVRHGKWVKTGQSFVYPDKFRNYSCSECGYDIAKVKYHYSPSILAPQLGQ